MQVGWNAHGERQALRGRSTAEHLRPHARAHRRGEPRSGQWRDFKSATLVTMSAGRNLVFVSGLAGVGVRYLRGERP